MIINKKFPGITKEKDHYKFVGNIVTDENLEINICLTVIGNIRVEGDLSTKKDIIINGNIHVEGDIYFGGNTNVEGYIWSGVYIYSKGYIKATGYIDGGSIFSNKFVVSGRYINIQGWIDNKEYVKAKGYISMLGIKTKKIYFLRKKRWEITILDTHLQIGREFYSKVKWKNFSDNEIKKMDEHLFVFWNKEKEFILNL